jgi:hypothetical protein
MEGIVVDVCAHPKICGLEPFHLFILRRACCVACIARAFFFLLDTTLAPLHSDRGFGFIVQIAAFSSLLMLVAGHLERRRKIAYPGGGHVCLLRSFYTLLERSDVWVYSEAFTKRYILLIFWLSLVMLLFFNQGGIFVIACDNLSLEIPSHFYDSFLWEYMYIAWTSILECMTYIYLHVQPIHLAGSLSALFTWASMSQLSENRVC